VFHQINDCCGLQVCVPAVRNSLLSESGCLFDAGVADQGGQNFGPDFKTVRTYGWADYDC
jgi:hypothetical protein